ncbi:hypothetical protein [Desulfovibrio sp. JC010]|uniref:TIGR03943 family putative permease subunit n=1 Tax=Desulfovibrio sp. JC010 TaxID=2593641 RepID=UPI0013D2350D|nr:hypothetical protein [Desulfovibrio sp. JC010]NDV28718.1 hypothetical protein [Desulfovibrio sp. JC010]
MLKKILAAALLFSVATAAGLFILKSTQPKANTAEDISKSDTDTAGLAEFKITTDKKKDGQEQRSDSDIKESLNGITYTKINVYELYDICERKDNALIGGNYVMRGVVYNEKQLGKDTSFVLMRHNLWCCPDHSISFGFRVNFDKAESLRNGQWVKVYGKLEKGALDAEAAMPSAEEMERINLAPNVDVEKNWIFTASKVEKVSAPEQLYITYWNTKEPFYY